MSIFVLVARLCPRYDPLPCCTSSPYPELMAIVEVLTDLPVAAGAAAGGVAALPAAKHAVDAVVEFGVQCAALLDSARTCPLPQQGDWNSEDDAIVRIPHLARMHEYCKWRAVP